MTANGVNFAYLEQGDGPMVLLLHGYPDNAYTWSHLVPALAEAGYRAVAPFTRGYPPTERPEGFYDAGTLATDARALIEALGGEPAHVIGHDWGAATTYYLIAAYPSSVRKAVTLAIPHPFQVFESFSSPALLQRAWHWWFYQLPDLPEQAVRANDFALIDHFWRSWSPGLDDADHVEQVKRSFAEPGAVEATLAYYRAMFDHTKRDPALAHVHSALAKPIEVPTMSVIGSKDIRRELGQAQERFFAGDFRFQIVEDAGHFLHREQPELLARLVLDWLA